MDIDMDSNKFTLDERDVVDNEEGIRRDGQLVYTKDVNVDSGREEALSSSSVSSKERSPERQFWNGYTPEREPGN